MPITHAMVYFRKRITYRKLRGLRRSYDESNFLPASSKPSSQPV